jgi:hypothetical protein
MEAEKSCIFVDYKGKKYDIALSVEGNFLAAVKEMILGKLKLTRPSVFGYSNIDIDCVTLYTDEELNEEIDQLRMPPGEIYFAKLVLEPVEDIEQVVDVEWIEENDSKD